MNITEHESIFCQALAITSLMAELSNTEFLKSEYYKKMNFQSNDKLIKYILNESGIGNPATMQMFLYALLVMPRELFEKIDIQNMDKCKNEINRLCSKLVETATNSTYSRENNINNIDYYKHIRNAVSHSKCSYTKINGVCYVNFYDTNVRDKNQTCHIIIKTLNVGIILEQLQKQLIEFLNMELNKRK